MDSGTREAVRSIIIQDWAVEGTPIGLNVVVVSIPVPSIPVALAVPYYRIQTVLVCAPSLISGSYVVR